MRLVVTFPGTWTRPPSITKTSFLAPATRRETSRGRATSQTTHPGGRSSGWMISPPEDVTVMTIWALLRAFFRLLVIFTAWPVWCIILLARLSSFVLSLAISKVFALPGNQMGAHRTNGAGSTNYNHVGFAISMPILAAASLVPSP